MNSDFYNDQKAVSSPFCSEHIAVTDEIFKRQEERGRDWERGRKKRRKENQEDATRLWYKIKSLWTRYKRKM